MAEGADTFEACRVRYGHTQERLAREGRGRLTASRVGEAERNWAPTRDCLAEFMRWGAVAEAPLPSARKFLDRYREQSFQLTGLGGNLAELASEGGPPFVDRVAETIIAAHPYFDGILAALADGPIICPAVSEGDIERGRRDGLGSEGWGRWAAEKIGSGINPKAVTKQIGSHLARRFGNPPAEQPHNKALAEATNDALMVSGFTARGLQIDAQSIKTLLRWGSELLLFDQSRYVPAYDDCNVIWLAADVERPAAGPPSATRRGVAAHGPEVAQALIKAYREQTESSESSLDAPYLPIHRVRAQAAFESQVTRALADLVLERLADDEFPEAGVTVFLHIGTTALPNSEPAFRQHGRRRLEVTMSNKEKESK